MSLEKHHNHKKNNKRHQTGGHKKRPLRPETPRLSVVIPALGPAAKLPRLVRRLRTWSAVKEIIVVANHCSPGTVRTVKQLGTRVINYREHLGHDTGRAVGALVAHGEYVLFLDADINWSLKELRPFLRCLETGADIALNRYPLPTSPRYHHPTAVVKRALNLALDKPHLKAASMTTVPNAVRKSVIEHVGAEYLAIPPLFLTRAVLDGYRIQTAAYCPVGARNPQPARRPYSYDVGKLILGDHAEAFHHLITTLGPRGYFPDHVRQRELLPASFVPRRKEGNPEAPGTGLTLARFRSLFQKRKPDMPILPDAGESKKRVAAVIPARNEARTITRVLKNLHTSDVHEVHVVDNGSTDGTEALAVQLGATVHKFDQALGHDVPRAIGVTQTQFQDTAAALFLDADFPVSWAALRPFVRATTDRGVDVALNNLSKGFKISQLKDPVSTMKRCLNLMVHRPRLKVSSATAVPHALSHRALDKLSPLDLAVPPRITVQSVLRGLVIRPVHFVDVVTKNPRRRMNRPATKSRRITRSSSQGSQRTSEQTHATHAVHAHNTSRVKTGSQGASKTTSRPLSGLSAPLTRLIIGDHLEALSLWFDAKGPRGGFSQPRRLDLLKEAVANFRSGIEPNGEEGVHEERDREEEGLEEQVREENRE